MMAETLVKEKICRACGADVRPQALFCYNCGSAVAPEVPLAENNQGRKDKKWIEKDPAALARTENPPDKSAAGKNAPGGKPPAVNGELKGAENSNNEKAAEGLKSAASMRRRGKPVQKKRVEIVWEEHDNAPNGWFILVAVGLTILAVAIWIVSTYLE